MVLSPLLQPESFDRLPGWHRDSLSASFRAFRRSATRPRGKPYRTGALGIEASAFEPAFAAAAALGEANEEQARQFFETFFRPYRVRPDTSTGGLVTGFYEPVVQASHVRDERHGVPLLCRPDDLIELDDATRPADWDPELRFARRSADGSLSDYPDRRAIELGALGDLARPLAWLSSKVDAFFIHVQGAARLRFHDGSEQRITYDGKSGHAFTGPGRVLAELGEIPLAQVTMQSIRAWLAAHPDRVDEILWRNRSYIFFRRTPLGDPAAGPVAAAKVQLEAGRSIAVDRLLHTFGTPIFVDAPELAAFEGAPFRRLMIAQDTGSAIVGSARGDLFAGTGDAAGEIAGVARHAADFYALVPRGLVEP